MEFFNNHTHVSLSVDEAGIAIVHMKDVVGKNGLTPHFVEELIACINEVKSNETFKVVIFKGTSEIFNSGADLKTLELLMILKMKLMKILLLKLNCWQTILIQIFIL